MLYCVLSRFSTVRLCLDWPNAFLGTRSEYLSMQHTLRLSRSQIKQSEPARWQAFDAAMVAKLNTAYPGRFDDRLGAYVTWSRKRAQDCGFSTDQHIYDLVEAACVSGGTMWTDAAFERIMSAPLKTREEKAVAVRRRFVLAQDATAAT